MSLPVPHCGLSPGCILCVHVTCRAIRSQLRSVQLQEPVLAPRMHRGDHSSSRGTSLLGLPVRGPHEEAVAQVTCHSGAYHFPIQVRTAAEGLVLILHKCVPGTGCSGHQHPFQWSFPAPRPRKPRSLHSQPARWCYCSHFKAKQSGVRRRVPNHPSCLLGASSISDTKQAPK